MWRMIRLIRKNERIWATGNTRLNAVKRLDAQYGDSPDFSLIVASEVSREIHKNDTLWMRKNAPMNAYALKYFPEIKAEGKGVIGYKNIHSQRANFAKQEAKAIFHNCQARDFVEFHPKDEELFRLTGKGRVFSDFTGLVLEWQKRLKPLYIAGAVAVAWIVREVIPLVWDGDQCIK